MLASLLEVATKLAANHPSKYERAHRRVRALLDGKWLFDTLGAVYVWEHPYCESGLISILGQVTLDH
jgi:hypothetical protein